MMDPMGVDMITTASSKIRLMQSHTITNAMGIYVEPEIRTVLGNFCMCSYLLLNLLVILS